MVHRVQPWVIGGCLLLLSLVPSCGATATPPAPVFLSIAGSTSMEPLLTELAGAYRAQHPHVAFDIQGGGSQLGLELVSEGRADVGLASWPPSNLPDDVLLVPIARDGVAIILNPQNRLAGLSLPVLRDIFSGHLLDWRGIDGPSLPIQVISREDGSGTRSAFEAIVMADQPVTPTAIVLPNSRAVVDFVAETPNAIAYVSSGFVRDDVYVVPIEGVRPTLDDISGGSYPLSRDLAVIMSQQSNPEAGRFVDFSLSPTGQAIVGQRWVRVR